MLMDIESLREYCIGKRGVTECFPFDENTLVFKVADKIFLLTDLSNPTSFNAKCNPEKAVALREEFEEVKPGYHMNKTHWNTVSMVGRLTEKQLQGLIDHSYELVFSGLSKKSQGQINELCGK